jgi:ABC-type multidrug transport system ATPase subunit
MQEVTQNNDPPLTIGSFDDKNADVIGFESESAMEEWILANPNTTQAAVSFLLENTTQLIGYTVYRNITSPYEREITAALLKLLAEASMRVKYSTLMRLNITVGGFPRQAVPLVPEEIVWSTGALWFYCPAMFNFILFTNQFVQEKERRVRLAMRTMGLRDVWFWLSWLITLALIALLHALVTVGAGYLLHFRFMFDTDPLVLIVLFVVYDLALLSFALFFAVLIQKASNSNAICFLFFILGFFLQLIFITISVYTFYDPDSTAVPRYVFALFPPFNYAKIYADISTVTWPFSAYVDHTYYWHSLHDAVRVELNDKTFTAAPSIESIYFLLGDIGLYLLLALYLDNVVPNPHGIPKPFYFIVNPRYYYQLCRVRKRNRSVAEQGPAITVESLFKKYRKYACCNSEQDTIAVNHLSFSVEPGQLLCLLGHNGAGKTTTLSILTGILAADGGDAHIYGHSVRHDMDQIRRLIGLCPQFDILWDELTAHEHLEVYAALKGIPNSRLRSEIITKLQEVNLDAVAHKQARTFSGGMRRRLSVAISIIGDPKIVFMDEPTTGMDPQSRSEVWRVIEQTKKQRLIVLTTHSMDEADVLSDVIGIMSAGKLRCFGPAIQLKREHGTGYYLNVICDSAATVKQCIAELIPRARITTENAGNIVFNIPMTHVQSLQKFFALLREKNEVTALIRDWSVSYTTLEEVFLRVTHDSPDEERSEEDDKAVPAGQSSGNEPTRGSNGSEREQIQFN